MLILLYVAIALACLAIMNRWLAPRRTLGPSEVEDFERGVLKEIRSLALEGFDVPGLGWRYLGYIGRETTAHPPTDPYVVAIRIRFELLDRPREAAKALEKPTAVSACVRIYNFVFRSGRSVEEQRRRLEEFVGEFATIEPPPLPPEDEIKNLE